MKFKKILSLLTAAAMTLSLGITSVSADTTEEAGSVVAKIGETEYTSLADAFNAAADKATITVVADTSIIGDAVRFNGISVTLDLNGKTITAENKVSGNIVLTDSAFLTLKDTVGGGSIISKTKYDGTNNTTKPVINVDNGSTFTMQSGTIESACEEDPANNGNSSVGVWKDSSATINGGTIKSGWYCVASNGQESNSNITINGGKLISTADYAIYAPAKNSTVTINNGTVNGAAGAIAMRAGDLIVNGGTLTSDKTGNTGTWGDGTSNLGNAVINLVSNYGSINARIHGGTITMAAGAEKPLMEIKKQDQALDFVIDGGAFSEDISEDYKAYIADGYEVVSESKLYKVYPYAEVLMNYKRYATIQDAQDAINALADNRDVSIYVRGDIKVNTPITIKNKKAVSINLNGNSITATGGNDVFSVDSCNSFKIFNGSSAKTTGAVAANGGRCVSVANTTKVTLKDANFTQEKEDADLIYADGTTAVTINSGSYKSVTPAKTLVTNGNNATFAVTGGTFYQYDPTAFVNTKTYYVGSDADGYYTVSKNLVAENTTTGKKYVTLYDAVKAVPTGGTATINLLEDISSGAGAAMITDNKDITINLNGHTIRASKVNSGVFVVVDAKLTIEGEGTVTALQNGGALAFDVLANATVNIKGGNFSQEISNDDGSGHFDFIYIEGDNSTVNISGGTFKAFTPKWTLNKLDSVTGSTFNVTGGTFVDYNPAENYAESKVPESLVANKFVSVDNGDGTYTVKPRAEDFGTVAVMTHGNGKLTLFTGINFLDYRNAGFIVGIDGKEIEVKTNKVYEQVTAGDTTFNTANAGAKYIYGAELTLDPSLNGSLKSFTVTPFADVLNKTAERIASSNVTTVKITGATAETTVEE